METLVQQFKQLAVDDQLAILWQTFSQMEKAESVETSQQLTPQTAQLFLQDLLQVDQSNQLAIIRDIVARADTRFGRGYSSLDRNMQLAFWYELAQTLSERNTLVPPADYQLGDEAEGVWRSLQALSAPEKATFAKTVISSMGSDVAELPVV
ncbi:orange carotenoid protein N-terminal domain-containing protein [Almyronema epifaneia]|uniref:Orange carotenoid protein N-terminal domain-containing protein n=1 Tax=Almyronema epifaneia S1 TaxID=2991925 RepID=A0ABW6IAE1_9CYAN